ncbi:PREDICTED: uncharacterized protein LOC104589508 [Nelumbo nucifera]|uniref:Uncharacterized protein LOC104589508 n=1 Tax=Nelumbo nucifera TaxID=4432 RepID=A0A1U7Z5P8_NELNU|nr:PREDICTED: uncharacterized protein LOC104589508 [Nelumbo nucifera]
MEKTVDSARKDWAIRLDDALWAYRTAYKTPSTCLPTGVERWLQLNELDEFRLAAYENAKVYKERTKRWHDRNLLRHDFHVGQQVLYNSRLLLFPGKLKLRWSGPFTITQVFHYGPIEVTHPAQGTFKVNGQHLKPYIVGGMLPTPSTLSLDDR